MAKKIIWMDSWVGGLAHGEKIGLQGSYRRGYGLDIHEDPNQINVQPKAVKVSGSTVTGLVKWIVDATPHDTNRYFYDNGGKIYKETSGGTWSSIRTVSNSVGQGLEIHDDYLYYTQNTQIGRYGPLSGVAAFTDNWQTSLNDTSASGFAPIMAFKEGFVVGHGNYVGWWDGAIWDPQRLTLPPGFNVRCFTVVDGVVLIGAWRGNSVVDSEAGYIFTWDGLTSTFIDFYPTDGAPNAFSNTNNDLYAILGSAGSVYQRFDPAQKVHGVPGMKVRKYAEVYPGAMGTWKNQTVIGYAGDTNTTDIDQGVYTYGAKDALFPEVLNLAFLISTGTKNSTTLKIGAVKGIGDSLYIGWRDGSSYGVDVVRPSNDAATVARMESVIHDDIDQNGRRTHSYKSMEILKVTHLPLVSGQSVKIEYRMDRDSSWTTLTTNTTVDSVETRLHVPSEAARYREAEFALELGTSVATGVTVTGAGFLFDDNREEENQF